MNLPPWVSNVDPPSHLGEWVKQESRSVMRSGNWHTCMTPMDENRHQLSCQPSFTLCSHGPQLAVLPASELLAGLPGVTPLRPGLPGTGGTAVTRDTALRAPHPPTCKRHRSWFRPASHRGHYSAAHVTALWHFLPAGVIATAAAAAGAGCCAHPAAASFLYRHQLFTQHGQPAAPQPGHHVAEGCQPADSSSSTNAPRQLT